MDLSITRFIIYTDGSCLGNPGKGGWASIIYDNNSIRAIELVGFDETTTNNRMELLAPIMALDFIEAWQRDRNHIIEIHSDSSYFLTSVVQWLPGWIRRGWSKSDGKPVKNQDLWERIQHHCAFYGPNLKFVKVKAHTGHLENERCDFLARNAATNQSLPTDTIASWVVLDVYKQNLAESENNSKTQSSKSKTNSLKPKSKIAKKSKTKKPVFYVSLVEGNVHVDTDWNSCQNRMKGHKSVFRKTLTCQDRDSVIKTFQQKANDEASHNPDILVIVDSDSNRRSIVSVSN